MKKINCSSCDQSVAQNESLLVDDLPLCESCLNEKYPNQEDLQGHRVIFSADPTICAKCQVDHDETELHQIANNPICEGCLKTLEQSIVPSWVKVFMVGIILLVAFSTYWNYKYYTAYEDLNLSVRESENGNFSDAALYSRSASNLVPELSDLNLLANYYEGVNQYQQGGYVEAKSKLQDAFGVFGPDNTDLNYLIANCDISICIENDDFIGAIRNAKILVRINSHDPFNLSSLSSMYSLIYAHDGEQAYADSSLIYLNKARDILKPTDNLDSYINLIEYRLATRDPISSADFYTKYPEGWNL